MTSLIRFKGTGSALFRRAFLLTLLLLVCFTVSPSTQAVLPPPPPDGGYPAGNTAEGTEALFKLDDEPGRVDEDNTAIGFRTLYEGEFSAQNTAVGSLALKNCEKGQYNTATGYQALYNTSQNYNTATGYKALALQRGFRDNTAVGSEAGSQLISGQRNVVVGAEAGNNLRTRSNDNIYIGNEGVDSESNTIRIGGRQTDTTFIGGIFRVDAGRVPIIINAEGQLGTVVSSQRFKDEIKPMGKASEAILALNPVTFRYKKEVDPEHTPQFGLVSEDVEKIDPELVVRDKEGKPYSVRYDQVNAMLLNEFLKAHAEIEEQEATMAQQQKQIEALAADLEKVSDQLELNKPAPQTVLNSQ